MKNSILSLVFFLCVVVFESCQQKDQRAGTNVVDTSRIDGRQKLENEIQTAIFIETVASREMLKVTLGKLAVEKAENSGVKSFGNLVVRDHKKMNDALKVLAIANGLKLPISLSKNDLKQVQEMSNMKTIYFEKLYMKMMIEDYNKDIELFGGAKNSPDTAVSNFARKFLPVLEIHRENAVKVRSGLTL
ncbi:DUF4142 domain-containing protein [Pedobacter hiemivivus]|uniref:DUF4142 domain-containing protein n=1 Tax=Pedobacter hiemivivus TaxID=2530454 RepID=A0A4U1G4T2_9SPHI|nr:DUF4142 domain-containing protein [Pedobacter hiemivivus]TKC57630.1 DUF4142 domain-containing protein [Pedobacter hiemivivus]